MIQTQTERSKRKDNNHNDDELLHAYWRCKRKRKRKRERKLKRKIEMARIMMMAENVSLDLFIVIDCFIMHPRQHRQLLNLGHHFAFIKTSLHQLTLSHSAIYLFIHLFIHIFVYLFLDDILPTACVHTPLIFFLPASLPPAILPPLIPSSAALSHSRIGRLMNVVN